MYFANDFNCSFPHRCHSDCKGFRCACANLLLLLFLFFLGPYLQHKEVLRLGVNLEQQLPACITATAMPGLSCVCDLYHSSRQCWILNLLSKARGRSCNLMVTSWLRFHCTTMGIHLPFYSLPILIVYVITVFCNSILIAVFRLFISGFVSVDYFPFVWITFVLLTCLLIFIEL